MFIRYLLNTFNEDSDQEPADILINIEESETGIE